MFKKKKEKKRRVEFIACIESDLQFRLIFNKQKPEKKTV
jgi:hypothetical protein